MCTCVTGFTGTTCDTEVDYCDPNPCGAGEDCIVDTESAIHSCVICIGKNRLRKDCYENTLHVPVNTSLAYC